MLIKMKEKGGGGREERREEGRGRRQEGKEGRKDGRTGEGRRNVGHLAVVRDRFQKEIGIGLCGLQYAEKSPDIWR